MTDEEIRMRCLELAASIDNVVFKGELFFFAEELRKWVIQDRYQSKNKIEFEKISDERSK